jgi:hypothetical protein
LAGEARHLPQKTEGQSSLKVQPVQAGHVRFEADGTPARLHVMGPKAAEFFAASCLQALGHNGNSG